LPSKSRNFTLKIINYYEKRKQYYQDKCVYCIIMISLRSRDKFRPFAAFRRNHKIKNIKGATRFPNSGEVAYMASPGFMKFKYKYFNIFNTAVGGGGGRGDCYLNLNVGPVDTLC